MNLIICKFSVAVIFTSICAAFILPIVYQTRGCFAIGGEWILLVIIFGGVVRLY